MRGSGPQRLRAPSRPARALVGFFAVIVMATTLLTMVSHKSAAQDLFIRDAHRRQGAKCIECGRPATLLQSRRAKDGLGYELVCAVGCRESVVDAITDPIEYTPPPRRRGRPHRMAAWLFPFKLAEAREKLGPGATARALQKELDLPRETFYRYLRASQGRSDRR